jgi:succinyl-diaminopimelate desuccinylase
MEFRKGIISSDAYKEFINNKTREVVKLQEEIGLDVVVEEVELGSPNVMAVLQGKDEGPCVMFECHTDVVTEGDTTEWKYDPFEGRLVGNRIYGRGSCDTKGNLAAAIQAVKAISKAGISLPGKILLGVLVDEEGLMRGVKHFIRQGGPCQWCRHL